MAERKYAFDWGKITKGILEKETKGGGNKEVDGRYFVAKRGEDGNAEYKMRFVSPKDFGDVMADPYAKWFHHEVKIGGKKLFTMCPTTLGDERNCPICHEYLDNWKTDKDYANIFKRKTNVVSNFVMIKDPMNSKNDGKIFLLKYGITIHKKILGAMFPPKNAADPAKYVYDYYVGANFKLVVKTEEFTDNKGEKQSLPNYDDSYFEGVSELDENLIEYAHENAYALGDFVKRENFDIEEEVAQKFAVFMEKVNGKKSSSVSNYTPSSETKKEEKSEETKEEVKTEEKPETLKTETKPDSVTTQQSSTQSEKPALNLEDDDDAFWANVKKNKKQ